MSATSGRRAPAPTSSLYDHALRLHRRTPDGPLPRGGKPYPGGRRPRPEPPEDYRTAGVPVARLLDEHFAQPLAQPRGLAQAFREVHVPIHPDEHIARAAHRAAPERARRTGRWLVQHGHEESTVTVGLALLAAVGTADDAPLIRTIGLLSDTFGPLAAHALERTEGGAAHLLWLADRVTGWGRVHVVEALCRLDDPATHPWLLRKAIDGDFLNGYFAGKVATAARLHEALPELGQDRGLLDHTGQLLRMLTHSAGMGMALRHYPHAATVLAAHARHAGGPPPTVERFCVVATLALHLATESAEYSGCTEAQREAILASYLALLDREDWYATARAALAAQNSWLLWFADFSESGLRLRVFEDWKAAADGAGEGR
ncbi:hypothetical protein [Streptomyces sp. 1331.2]|uniref:hypothetical protein n=1 Tax=Streptomyces sp. 1331.2 TaxID=1938835 RepID=UPI000BC831C7|nr:hypothetical protein [Streptomyces sp. 1331.2]SOB85530.1 hypothetical protein SAMN06272789_5818 [Streptomyces sp. 1331.2]